MGLGKKIYELRVEQGLTQKDLSIRAGVCRSELQKIEYDMELESIDPSISTIVVIKIANALGVKPSELLEIKKYAQ